MAPCLKIARGWLMPEPSPQQPPTDTSDLILAVAGQDRAAFAELFKRFAPRIKTMLMRGGLDAARAEEIAQEALLTIWRKAGKFDPAGASASAWIYTIARNLRIDAARRDQRRSRLLEAVGREPLDTEISAIDSVSSAETGSRVRNAMRTLSLEQFQVVTLSFLEGKAHPDIAESLGLPLGTVKSRLRLAMTHLRKSLEDLA